MRVFDAAISPLEPLLPCVYSAVKDSVKSVAAAGTDETDTVNVTIGFIVDDQALLAWNTIWPAPAEKTVHVVLPPDAELPLL